MTQPEETSPEDRTAATDTRTRTRQEQRAATTMASTSDKLQVAPPDAKEQGVRRFAGQEVRTAAGEELGTLKDFVVDASTGKVPYAVVSSGGFLGAGDTLRAIPCEALQQTSAGEGFTVNVDAAQWKQIPVLNQDDFNAGRFNISSDQQRELAQVFGSEAKQTAVADTTSAPMQLQRASEIRGKSIQSGQQDIGSIEEVLIHLEQGTATALVDPEDDFTAGADTEFLVPLQRLNLASGDRAVTTTLARSDFEQAQGSTSNIATTSPQTQTTTDEQLTPTGRTSAEQTPEADASAVESARAVRNALDDDESLASANVQVVPQGGKIVLKGTARDQQMKMNIERMARDAASDATIENKITVQGQQR